MQENTYETLEAIQLRKDALRTDIAKESQQIGELWTGLTSTQKPASKGELIAGLVSNSITAIDAFLLVRKLMRNYGWLAGKLIRKRK